MPTKMEKSFGKNRKKPKGQRDFRKPKMTLEKPKLYWDSQEQG
jgi:hypothetical protein